MQYIRVFKEDIPYRVDIKIEDETFNFRFDYNSYGDFFTVDLEKQDEILALGEKVVYGQALFVSIANEKFPRAALLPLDPSVQNSRVTWETLENGVYIYIYTRDMLPETVEPERRPREIYYHPMPI